MPKGKWIRATLFAGFAIAILATGAVAGAAPLGDQDPAQGRHAGQDPIHPLPWGDFDYKKIADQNRYLINKPGDPNQPLPNDPNVHKIVRLPGPNMEPVVVHPEQIQEAIDKLQSKGFCAAVLQRQCPNCQIKQEVEKRCKRPNILIFLVDDMGWGDFGPYGGGVTYGAATPNVDRLANEGLVLTSTYSQPTCSPSRATIHTGQLPVHHGVLYPPMYGDPGGLTRRSKPLPWLLKKQGYRTQGVGKWHMGENKPNMPYRIGYDDYYGFLSVSDMYTEWRDQYYNPEVVRDQERTRYMQNNKFSHYLVDVVAPPNVTPTDDGNDLGDADDEASKWRGQPDPNCHALAEITLPWEAKALNEENERRTQNGQTPIPNYGNPNFCTPLKDNSRRVSIADLDELWAESSVKFIREMAGKSQPWFLYHGTRGCHFDNYPQVGDRRASYARTVYSDCTVEMDDIFGKLMRALQETGQEETTLVFFTSDNGPEDEIPPHGHTPFRGGKGDTWEGGVRAPGIARWKGMITPGRRSDGLFDQADLYTTALSLAGFDYENAPELKDRYLYGIDQTSFLVAKDGESNRRSVLHWYLTNFSAVRMDEFKAHHIVSEPVGLSQGYPGGLSGVDLTVSYLWLFNLQEDPKEQNNINIRHLWAQHLFSGEFDRFMCVLTQYPPHLPTEPAKELGYLSQIQMLKSNIEKYWTACQELPSGKTKS